MNILRASHRVELDKIKGSRFIGDCVPVSTPEEAERALQAIRDEFPDASHHCFAWQLRGDRYRYSDDGEPSGSAGKPIHAVIGGRDLVDTLVVVTRYFGGTKLGVGGLVRGYGAAAAAVLDAASIAPYVPMVTLVLSFDYRDQGAVRSVLTMFELEESEASFGEGVSFTLQVREEMAPELRHQLVERTAGRISFPD